jgi:hypothetical protein
MVLGVMQPYIFPYIGYFQLINKADVFVFYDDVTFIKRGWINRNKILVNKKDSLFTVPLSKMSQNSLIINTKVSNDLYKKWSVNFFKTVKQSYSKGPYFNEVYTIIENTFLKNRNDTIYISDLCQASIIACCQYLGITTKFMKSSELLHSHKECNRTDRLINIAKDLNCTTYINSIGGKELYEKEYFKEMGIGLSFLKPNSIEYLQNDSNEFVPWLSMLDVMMFNTKEQISVMLNDFKLL